ncbi:MAG: hypothetical protein IE935_15980 [Micrococcales bacterium]|nr:hypothetical protein [Micrococcales bacterium]
MFFSTSVDCLRNACVSQSRVTDSIAGPLPSLRGTIIVLHDVGFSDDEAIDWMLTLDDTIGVAPIEALRAGRKSEVRRVAQTLA